MFSSYWVSIYIFIYTELIYHLKSSFLVYSSCFIWYLLKHDLLKSKNIRCNYLYIRRRSFILFSFVFITKLIYLKHKKNSITTFYGSLSFRKWWSPKKAPNAASFLFLLIDMDDFLRAVFRSDSTSSCFRFNTVSFNLFSVSKLFILDSCFLVSFLSWASSLFFLNSNSRCLQQSWNEYYLNKKVRTI